MKNFKNYILLFSSLLMAMPLAAQDCKSLKLAAEKIQVSHVEMSHHNDLITVMMDLNLDSLDLLLTTSLCILRLSSIRESCSRCLRL